MTVIESLRPECLKIGSGARNKKEVLKEIARLAKNCSLLAKVKEEAICRALEAREAIGSTAYGKGIAIPHCKLDRLQEFVVGLLIVPQGVDFEAADGEKTRAIFFILGPSEKRGEHIQILSSVSKLLKTPAAVEQLVKARDRKALLEEFFKLDQYKEGLQPQAAKSLITVFLQKEKYFLDILQILAASARGSINVFESLSAGHYLRSLPLFAPFQPEGQTSFSRILLAVVDRELGNDIVRRIHMIDDAVERGSGVLITVQDLAYASGSLSY